jgi:cytochrome c biogenesis protein CcdA
MARAQKYTLSFLQEREEQLKNERRFLPVILGDENDLKKASIIVVVLGFGALLVELGFAYYFFAKILMLNWIVSAFLALAVVVASVLGLEQILEFFYTKAQKANSQLRQLNDHITTNHQD